MSKTYEVEVKVTSFYRLSLRASSITEAHKKVESKLNRIEGGYIPPKSKRMAQYASYERLAPKAQSKSNKESKR